MWGSRSLQGNIWWLARFLPLRSAAATRCPFLPFTLVLLAFNGCGAARALLGIAAGVVHVITVVLDMQHAGYVRGGAHVVRLK